MRVALLLTLLGSWGLVVTGMVLYDLRVGLIAAGVLLAVLALGFPWPDEWSA